MSDKFHIKPDGSIAKCTATKGKCPYGGANEHYDSPNEAYEAFQNRMEKEEKIGKTIASKNKSFLKNKSQQKADSALSSKYSYSRLSHADWDKDDLVNNAEERIATDLRKFPKNHSIVITEVRNGNPIYTIHTSKSDGWYTQRIWNDRNSGKIESWDVSKQKEQKVVTDILNDVVNPHQGYQMQIYKI
jgi:outer membrane lipoprotein-sorting protein